MAGEAFANAISRIGDTYLSTTLRNIEQDKQRKQQLEDRQTARQYQIDDEQRRIQQQKDFSEWEYRQRAKRAGVPNADDPNVPLDAIATQLEQVERDKRARDLSSDLKIKNDAAVAGQAALHRGQRSLQRTDRIEAVWDELIDMGVEIPDEATDDEIAMASQIKTAKHNAGRSLEIYQQIREDKQDLETLNRQLIREAGKNGEHTQLDLATKQAKDAKAQWEATARAAGNDEKKLTAAKRVWLIANTANSNGQILTPDGNIIDLNKLKAAQLDSMLTSVQAKLESNPGDWAASVGRISQKSWDLENRTNEQLRMIAMRNAGMGNSAVAQLISQRQAILEKHIGEIQKLDVPVDWSQPDQSKAYDLTRRLIKGEFNDLQEFTNARFQAASEMKTRVDLVTGLHQVDPSFATKPPPAMSKDLDADLPVESRNPATTKVLRTANAIRTEAPVEAVPDENASAADLIAYRQRQAAAEKRNEDIRFLQQQNAEEQARRESLEADAKAKAASARRATLNDMGRRPVEVIGEPGTGGFFPPTDPQEDLSRAQASIAAMKAGRYPAPDMSISAGDLAAGAWEGIKAGSPIVQTWRTAVDAARRFAEHPMNQRTESVEGKATDNGDGTVTVVINGLPQVLSKRDYVAYLAQTAR